MTPQHQTLFGNGHDDAPRGNCFATAIACILDLPIAEVPNFCITDDWRGVTNVWLKDYGLFYLDIGIPSDQRAEHLFEFAGYHVISGQGPRGCRHSVVGKAGKMVHDPHPSGAGLLTEEEYGFLIPLDPAKIGKPDPFQMYKDGVCAHCDEDGQKTIGETVRCRHCLHEFCERCLSQHECAEFEIQD